MPPLPPAVPDAVAPWAGFWSRPPDRPAEVALAVAALLFVTALVPTGPARLAGLIDVVNIGDLTKKRRFLTVMAFIAAFLSLGYVAFYLRGGPRDALAPAYWLEGRAFSHGEMSWNASDPIASFRARDVLATLPGRLAGIFPPGFPLLLAPAFLLGAPMVVGPLLAAGLVVATWALAREMAEASGEVGSERAEGIARVAVGLSILSAGLRLYTADALPHGATAFALTGALAAALRARRLGDPRLFGLTGLAFGGVLATHPMSAIALGAILLSIVLGARRATGVAARRASLTWLVLTALPGAGLLLLANRAAIGEAFGAPLAVYFRSIGVDDPLATDSEVLDLVRRFRVHLVDVANLEPLALFAAVPLFAGRRPAAARLAGLLVLGQFVLVGLLGQDYAGAAAGRDLASVLPVEHALVALGLARLFPRALSRAAAGAFALALLGFGVHAARDHDDLAKSDLGRPHYEPDAARDASVAHGLLYFEDDLGFELAFDPGARASHGIEAVRMLGDDHDRMLFDELGHPAIHRYIAAAAGPTVVAWTPPGNGMDSWRFEAENEWPATRDATAAAEVVSVPCASSGKALAVTSPEVGEGLVTLNLPVPRGGANLESRTWHVVPKVVQRGSSGAGTITLIAAPGGPTLAEWTWSDRAVDTRKPPEPPSSLPTCLDLPARPVELGGDRPRAWLVVHAEGGSVTLDKTTLLPR